MKNVTKLKGVYGWVFVLFADPTDTWWSAIGLFFILFYFFKSDKIKKKIEPHFGVLRYCCSKMQKCESWKKLTRSMELNWMFAGGATERGRWYGSNRGRQGV